MLNKCVVYVSNSVYGLKAKLKNRNGMEMLQMVIIIAIAVAMAAAFYLAFRTYAGTGASPFWTKVSASVNSLFNNGTTGG